MPTTFRPYQPDQMLLLAPDLREWLTSGHLTHQVSDLVDALELNPLYAPYEGDGRRNAPYEPSMMVKILIYAYATGVFSSRAIARKLEDDEFMLGLEEVVHRKFVVVSLPFVTIRGHNGKRLPL